MRLTVLGAGAIGPATAVLAVGQRLRRVLRQLQPPRDIRHRQARGSDQRRRAVGNIKGGGEVGERIIAQPPPDCLGDGQLTGRGEQQDVAIRRGAGRPPITDAIAFGVAFHLDYGMITLLAQDPIGGLELRKHDGEWVRASFVEGTFKVWTNDLYLSNAHRACELIRKKSLLYIDFIQSAMTPPARVRPECLSPKHPRPVSADQIRRRPDQPFSGRSEVRAP